MQAPSQIESSLYDPQEDANINNIMGNLGNYGDDDDDDEHMLN